MSFEAGTVSAQGSLRTLVASTAHSCVPFTSSLVIQGQVPPYCCNFCFFLKLEVKKDLLMENFKAPKWPRHTKSCHFVKLGLNIPRCCWEICWLWFFSKNSFSKEHLEWKILWALQHTEECAASGLESSAVDPAAQWAGWILEHLTLQECKEVALRSQAAQPGQSCALSLPGAGEGASSLQIGIRGNRWWPMETTVSGGRMTTHAHREPWPMLQQRWIPHAPAQFVA